MRSHRYSPFGSRNSLDNSSPASFISLCLKLGGQDDIVAIQSLRHISRRNQRLSSDILFNKANDSDASTATFNNLKGLQIFRRQASVCVNDIAQDPWLMGNPVSKQQSVRLARCF